MLLFRQASKYIARLNWIIGPEIVELWWPPRGNFNTLSHGCIVTLYRYSTQPQNMDSCGTMAISSTSGQGRPKGAKNKATAELQELARTYTAAALAELGRLSVAAESETARVAACNSLLDRGYGKPNQALEVTHDGELTLQSAPVSAVNSFFAEAFGPGQGIHHPDTLPN